MIGYLIVIALVVLAVGAVLVALSVEGDDASTGAPARAHDPDGPGDNRS